MHPIHPPTVSPPSTQPPRTPSPTNQNLLIDLTTSPDPPKLDHQPPPTIAAPLPTLHFSTLPHSELISTERRSINHHYGLDCTIRSRQSRGQGHRIQHPQLYRLCTGGLLSGDLLRALLDLQSSTTPTIYTGHLDNWVRDPLQSNTPSRRLLQQLFQAHTILLLHNHDNTHWGLSITLRKANHHHIIYLDSLNNRYPALEEDLTHF